MPCRRIAALACLALLAMHDAAPAQVRTSWKTFTSGGKPVAAECFAPRGKGPAPVVLVLHGSGGLEGGSGPAFREVSNSLARRGFLVVLPHLFDPTDHRAGGPFTPEDDASMIAAVADAIAFAATLPGADGDRVGLVGLSMGSSLAMIASARDPRVKAVASWSGAYPDAIPPEAPACPTLILHGARDNLAGPEQARAYAGALQGRGVAHDLHVYPGVGHNFDATRFRDATNRTAAFFLKHVKPPAPEPEPAKTQPG